MFKFPSLFARAAPEHSASACDPHRFHGSLYCAARNVYLTAETVFTTRDADRLFCALSELHKLGAALDSPAPDLAEMAAWRDAVGAAARFDAIQVSRASVGGQSAGRPIRSCVDRDRP